MSYYDYYFYIWCVLRTFPWIKRLPLGAYYEYYMYSLAKDCQILPGKYPAILASQGNMHNKH